MTCPHCLGPGCVHCRERAAELSRQRRRSRLTDTERQALEVMPRRGLRFALPGVTPEPRRRCLGTPVLPANFRL